MDTKLAEYYSFRNVVNKMLWCCRVWPYPQDSVFYYKIITFIAILVCCTNGAKVGSFALANMNNVSLFVESISNVFGMYTILLKAVSFLLYRKDLVLLDEKLAYTFEKELENKANRPVLLQGLSVYRRFLYFVSGIVILAAAMYNIASIIRVLKYKIYDFPYQGAYPFPVVPATTLYWILFAYETIFNWFVVNVTCGVDNAFGLHCFRACGLLRLTAQRWEQFQPNDPKSKQQLREYVQMHQLIIRSRDSLQRVYGFIVLWNYVSISLILCSLLWQGDQVKNNITVAGIIYFACYIVFKSLQAFTYSYYGSLVSEESENYQDAIFASDWPSSGNVRLMKDLLIVHKQRIMSLKACGYFYITMEMFQKIVNTGLSYFFLLQTVESKP